MRDVAKKLQVSAATVYKLVAQGALPCVRVVNSIRIASSSLDEYLAKAATPVTPTEPTPPSDGGGAS